MKRKYLLPGVHIVTLDKKDLIQTSGPLTVKENLDGNDDKAKLTDLFK